MFTAILFLWSMWNLTPYWCRQKTPATLKPPWACSRPRDGVGRRGNCGDSWNGSISDWQVLKIKKYWTILTGCYWRQLRGDRIKFMRNPYPNVGVHPAVDGTMSKLTAAWQAVKVFWNYSVSDLEPGLKNNALTCPMAFLFYNPHAEFFQSPRIKTML